MRVVRHLRYGYDFLLSTPSPVPVTIFSAAVGTLYRARTRVPLIVSPCWPNRHKRSKAIAFQWRQTGGSCRHQNDTIVINYSDSVAREHLSRPPALVAREWWRRSRVTPLSPTLTPEDAFISNKKKTRVGCKNGRTNLLPTDRFWDTELLTDAARVDSSRSGV